MKNTRFIIIIMKISWLFVLSFCFLLQYFIAMISNFAQQKFPSFQHKN